MSKKNKQKKQSAESSKKNKLSAKSKQETSRDKAENKKSALEKLKDLNKPKVEFEEPKYKIKENEKDKDMIQDKEKNKLNNPSEMREIGKKDEDKEFNKNADKRSGLDKDLREKKQEIDDYLKKDKINKEEIKDYFSNEEKVKNEEAKQETNNNQNKKQETNNNQNKKDAEKYFEKNSADKFIKHPAWIKDAILKKNETQESKENNKPKNKKQETNNNQNKKDAEQYFEKNVNGEETEKEKKSINEKEKDISHLNVEWNNEEKKRHLNWLKKEIIQKPNREDFSNYKFKEHPEWIKDADQKRIKIQKNYVKKPKWIKEKDEKIGKEKIERESEKKEKDNFENINTVIDKLFNILEKKESIDIGVLAKEINLNYYETENIIKIFENEEIVKIKYPVSLAKPRAKLINPVKEVIEKVPQGNIEENYKLIVDSVPAKVTIIRTKEEPRPVYSIEIPAIGKYTHKFLELIKGEIVEDIPIDLDEIRDPKKSAGLKKKFFEEARKKLVKYFKHSPQELLNIMSGLILHQIYGLGNIELILGDDMLEEVAINSSKTPITIYHRIHGWMKTNLKIASEEEIMNYASQIGRKVGREITVLSPILDAHLLSGDRVNATLFPVSAEGNTITIRRFARRPWTLTDFIGKAHTMNEEMAAMLWLAMQYELNILIAGGTASGKTSALNTLLALIPSYHRTISIEDVREIVLPKYLNWNWIPMVTRAANPEGLGEVTMLDCMITSLRMRPDRIVVGEMRRKKEAEVMMEAIETGHSIYSTLHANSAYQVLRRLGEPPMSIPIMQIEQLDLIVVQYRDRKTNKRRTLEIAEIEQTSTGKGLQVNTIYRWAPRTDSWEQLNRPTKLLTLLNLHTGLTEEEVYEDLEKRKTILRWMKDKEITDIDTIGYLMKLYYSDHEKVLEMATKGTTIEELNEVSK